MTNIAAANLAMIHHVAVHLGEWVDQVVFTGGAAIALLITDPAAGDVRQTIDVDVIVEVTTTAEYHRLAGQLRDLDFSEDSSEGAPLCRWLIGGVKVDIMPIDEASLGFSNRWYAPAFEHAAMRQVEGLSIRVVTAPFFLATKFEAFKSRGNGDFMGSHDIEDIVALIDGREELVEEVTQAPEDLQQYLAEVFQGLLANPRFMEALPGHLPGDVASQQRLPILEARMRAVSDLG
ncbi:MAG: hypothetical protein C0614_13960 [Desulfuromonas sp.]|nr:MAG: hypothetical protein C0614_13960 [Desulfuromonas sp.]